MDGDRCKKCGTTDLTYVIGRFFLCNLGCDSDFAEPAEDTKPDWKANCAHHEYVYDTRGTTTKIKGAWCRVCGALLGVGSITYRMP